MADEIPNFGMLLAQDASVVKTLNSLSALEEESATYLDQLLADPAPKLDP